MVGVPGRSKGCNTCRKRRVKCDETKPQCHRCLKAGIDCFGYDRATQWRHTSTAPFPVTLFQANETSGAIASVVSRGPSQELSLVAFEGTMCFAQLFQNFVWRTYGSLWLERAAEGKLGRLSLDAAEALSQNNFGRQNRTQDVQLKGIAQYGKCLRILASELSNASALKQRGQDLVVPILVLMIYSCDRAAAVFHLKGIANMLYVCGPEAFQQQPLRNAFDAARGTLLVASLFSKQQMFLDEPRWQNVPWELDPTSKTPQSYLLDIFVTIPGLLEENCRLEEGGNHYPSYDFLDPFLVLDDKALRQAELCDRIAEQLENLYLWRWNWQNEYGRYVSVDPSGWQPTGKATKALGSIGNSRFMDRLKFDRPVRANEIMLYNSALMWLLALLWKLEPLQAGSIIEGCARNAANMARTCPVNQRSHPTVGGSCSIKSFEPLRRPGASVSIRDPAMEICRVYEWLSRNHEKVQASEDQMCLYLFPVGMARSVLDKEPEYKVWIQSLLETSPVTAGYGREGENVVGFGFYVTKEALDPDIVEVDAITTSVWGEGIKV